jgi:hypothetical protein
MYTIQLDQTKNFECSLKIQGASLKKSKINMIIEGDDFDIKLKGTIDSDGQVTIPVKKLKGILDENVKGNMFLEVIAEDTYFTPYETEYVTEVSRKVEVTSINGKSKETLTESEGIKVTDSKPKVTISDIKNDDTLLIKEHANRINKNIIRSNLNIFKKEDKIKVIKTIQNYLTENKVENSLYDKIMTELYTLLSDDLS